MYPADTSLLGNWSLQMFCLSKFSSQRTVKFQRIYRDPSPSPSYKVRPIKSVAVILGRCVSKKFLKSPVEHAGHGSH